MHSGADNTDSATEYTQLTTDAAIARLSAALRKSETRQSLYECQCCGETIAQARREAVKGVRLCVSCADLEWVRVNGVPRRG